MGREVSILACCSQLIKFSFVEAGSLPLSHTGSSLIQLLLSDNMKRGTTTAHGRCHVVLEGGGRREEARVQPAWGQGSGERSAGLQ